MKIYELIKKLEGLYDRYGNLEVCYFDSKGEGEITSVHPCCLLLEPDNNWIELSDIPPLQ